MVEWLSEPVVMFWLRTWVAIGILLVYWEFWIRLFDRTGFWTAAFIKEMRDNGD